MGVMNDGDLMFSCECDEPKIGKITRNVYKVEFTPENLQKIYDKASPFRTLMGWEIPTYEHFISFFVAPNRDGTFSSRGLCARIDDFVGIFWLSDINYDKPPFSASIHYSFFDRRHRGRLELCRAAINHVFEVYGFERLWTKVPLYMFQPREGAPRIENKESKWSVHDFVERIGFKKEGREKNAMIYKDHKFDANLYALTRNDALNGASYRKADLRYTGKNTWAPGAQITLSK